MDGSQLPTEWTHLNSDLVTGVSDSKKRDGSFQQNSIATKTGPMTKNHDDPVSSKMSKTSKKSHMA